MSVCLLIYNDTSFNSSFNYRELYTYIYLAFPIELRCYLNKMIYNILKKPTLGCLHSSVSTRKERGRKLYISLN